MIRLVFTTSLVALLSTGAVNCAAAASAIECNQHYEACTKDCNSKNSLDERYICQGGCEGGIQGCLTGAAINADLRAQERKKKAIEERKKITCTTPKGNVQHCVQHGQDLLPAAVNFKGKQALECNQEYDACRKSCSSKDDSHGDREMCLAGCDGGVAGCLRAAAVAAEFKERDLKQRAIEERKKITCTTPKGNVQHCVQHGQDLNP